MGELTAENARKVLEEEVKQRVQRCQHIINEALRLHGCDLVAQPYFTPDGRVAARVRLVPVGGDRVPAGRGC